MSSAAFPKATSQHDDPIGSMIFPACTQTVAAREPIPDRPRVERPPSECPCGLSVAAPGDPAAEIEALAALLAEVVELAGDRAMFPSRWIEVAELAMEHDSVRRALLDLWGAAS